MESPHLFEWAYNAFFSFQFFWSKFGLLNMASHPSIIRGECFDLTSYSRAGIAPLPRGISTIWSPVPVVVFLYTKSLASYTRHSFCLNLSPVTEGNAFGLGEPLPKFFLVLNLTGYVRARRCTCQAMYLPGNCTCNVSLLR